MPISRIQAPYRSSMSFGATNSRPTRRDALRDMAQAGYRIFQAGLGVSVLGALLSAKEEFSPRGYALRRENPRKADIQNTSLMLPGGGLVSTLGTAAAILAEQGQKNPETKVT